MTDRGREQRIRLERLNDLVKEILSGDVFKMIVQAACLMRELQGLDCEPVILPNVSFQEPTEADIKWGQSMAEQLERDCTSSVPPPYIPPTIDDLVTVRKGGFGFFPGKKRKHAYEEADPDVEASCWASGRKGGCGGEIVNMDPVDADAASLCMKHASDDVIALLTQDSWTDTREKRTQVWRIIATVRETLIEIEQGKDY